QRALAHSTSLSLVTLLTSQHQRPALTPLFPYTTLFRSLAIGTKTGAVARAIPRAFSGIKVHHATHVRAFCRKGVKASCFIAIYRDRKSTRLNSSHVKISYAVSCLKKKRDMKVPSAASKS